jgi:hypothetical protein
MEDCLAVFLAKSRKANERTPDVEVGCVRSYVCVWRISNWLGAMAVLVAVQRVVRCNMTQRKTSEAVPITVGLAPLCVTP